MGQQYTYTLKFDSEGITSESLSVHDNLVFNVVGGKILEFTGKIPPMLKESDVEDTFKSLCISQESHKQKKTFLGTMSKFFIGSSAELSTAFDFFKDRLLFIDPKEPFYSGFKALAKTFDADESMQERLAIDEIIKHLKNLDFHIEAMHILRQPASVVLQNMEGNPALSKLKELMGNNLEEELVTLMTTHKNDAGDSFVLNISQESEGTQRVIGLLGYLLAAVRSGKVVVIDELDCSMHSLLVTELVRLFKERRHNQSNAQLLFTLHNTDLLSAKILRVSEISVARQLGFYGTELLRLSSVPNLRNVDDFHRRYLRGDFGGIPAAFL